MIDQSAQRAKTEFIECFIEASQGPRTVFTSDIVKQIGEEFGIPITEQDLVGGILEAGALQWSAETRLEALDFECVRKDLRSLEKAAKSLTAIVDNLAPDALEILVRVGNVLRLKDMPYPRITQSETSPILGYTDPAYDMSRCIPLSEARSIVSALGQRADYALEKVNESRKGRPENGALVDLSLSRSLISVTI